MRKTLAAAAIALVVAGPAFAEGGGENDNNGLPQETTIGTVAPGQPSYVLSHGHLVNLQDVLDHQLATLPAGTAPRTGPYDDQAYGPNRPEANGLNTSPGTNGLVGGFH